MSFEMLNEAPQGTIIKVVGVGGAGGNAIEHMIRNNVQGVEFISANTDAQALGQASAQLTLQLGESGLGAGAKPEVGRAAAEENRERIADMLRGANMVFITAGMGGGTGTGAAPVIAEISKQLGILTVGVVSKPFEHEGKRRMQVAEEGLRQLEQHVDSLIVVLNEKLEETLGEDALQDEMHEAADAVLNNAVAGISEIINVQGNINVDFNDVKTVMGEQGRAMMGSGTASGPERARIAAEEAIASPLLDGVNLAGARGILINISASRDTLKGRETREATNLIRERASEDATIIMGLAYDESLGDKMRVTVVATGLGGARRVETDNVATRVSANDVTSIYVEPTLDHEMSAPAGWVQTGNTAQSVETAPRRPVSVPTFGDYNELDVPAYERRAQQHTAQRAVNGENFIEDLDVPAFLRRQAD
jgi:cell division protein FtsZ